jgi:hypothetical protein
MILFKGEEESFEMLCVVVVCFSHERESKRSDCFLGLTPLRMKNRENEGLS